MAEPIPIYNINVPYRQRSYLREIAKETITGVIVGGFVRNGTRTGVVFIGLSGWQAVVVGGAIGGAIMGGGREWVRQSRENWIQPIDPASNRYSERLRDSLPTNWGQVGIAAGRGALFGAVGGFAGGFLVDTLHDPFERASGAIDETFNRFGTSIHRGWEEITKVFSGIQLKDTPPTPTAFARVTVSPTSTDIPTDIPKPTIAPTPDVPQPTAVPKPTPGVSGPSTPWPATPGVEPGSTHPVPGPKVPNVILIPSNPITPNDLTFEQKVAFAEIRPDFKTHLAGTVGGALESQDEIIRKALAVQGMNMNEVPQASINKARVAIQNALENQGNNSYDSATKTVFAQNPSWSPFTHSEDLKNAGRATFDNWFADSENQAKLAGVAQTAINNDLAVIHANPTEAISQFVVENQNNHEIFVDHVVARGETAWSMVEQMGLGHDVVGFAALNEMNPGMFTQLATGMGLSHEQLMALVLKAQNGDSAAYQEILKHMSLIHAGDHIKMLTSQGTRRLLAYAG